MEELTKSQKGRLAIRTFQTTADALTLRGYYKPSGRSGQTLEDALREISPEIYGTMNDSRSIEINGLEYVLDRLPRGIEECSRIILTAQEDLEHTAFEKIEPHKRRRISYRMSEKEICFVITRGLSEIYDVLTHLTFLNIEANKIYNKTRSRDGEVSVMWKELSENVVKEAELSDKQLDKAIWNLSMLLGRTYQETRQTYESLEESRKEKKANNGLFRIIHQLGIRVEKGETSADNHLTIFFTPSLRDMIGHQKISRGWANTINDKLTELELADRPLHIISANMHSVKNLLYGFAAIKKTKKEKPNEDIYAFAGRIRDKSEKIKLYAQKHGLHEIQDTSGANIDVQIIDTANLKSLSFHPDLKFDKSIFAGEKPIILVMDYAFGTQAYEVMDELLNPNQEGTSVHRKKVHSISVMGKAGILPGRKGDIMLASAHVLEGTAHNYLVNNDLGIEDFDGSIDVFEGPIVTVLGTSMQNRDVLEKFQTTDWKAVGLEMEGGHYQRSINAAIIKGHISRKTRTRYAYYASDNPLSSGQTLASGGMGDEGIRPTYMITRTILEKILN